jgi:two-component system C4-dicarboxylate transport sensor histidine kinase DctB
MRVSRQLGGLIALVASIGLIAAAYLAAAAWANGEQAAQGTRQLQLIAPELESALAKYETLPYALGFQPDMARVLAEPNDKAALARANHAMQAIARQARVEAIYLMDRSGTTLAASNWDSPVTFVGKNFGFRPYFLDAMAGRAGRFYAIGNTSLLPGYFITQPLRVGGSVAGVIAVKISLSDFERGWGSSEHALALVDEAGIIFLSNRPAWKYQSLNRIAPAMQRKLDATHQYADIAIVPMSPLPPAAPLKHDIGRLGWQLLLFPSNARVGRTAALWAMAAALVLASSFLASWALHQRRRRLQEQRLSSAALRQAAQELDMRIAEGTRQLRQTNHDLESKYLTLKNTESMLRATQDELVQAGKLAMLGQMAAGMTHELNQPLAAIRAFADNARTFLSRGQGEQAQTNLQHISDASARMGAIIAQLKGFARKDENVGTVDLDTSVRASILLLRGDIERLGATLEMQASEGGPLLVTGDSVRIEQVFINLLRNALDAVEQAERRRITVRLERRAGRAHVLIRDSGEGIPGHLASRLWEPFFTTKPAGKGLGLGLAISSSIVQAMGGQLDAHNHRSGGAEFEVSLPLQQEGDTDARNPG